MRARGVKRWMRAIGVACILCAFSFNGVSQSISNDTLPFHGLPYDVMVFEGDTVPVYMLNEVAVFAQLIFKNNREQLKYTKLVRDIKKTLPYARLCRKHITDIETTLSSMTDESAKKQYVKEAEKRLFAEFEKPLKNLTFTQGRLLIKLIDRETGDTSYDLIKDIKGGFSAFVWQSVARMFGSNLKSEYDASGEDSKIESVIYLIDLGSY